MSCVITPFDPPYQVRENAFGANGVLDLEHPAGDEIERLVPAYPREGALALGALSDRRVEQAILAVDAFVEPSDLGADEIPRGGIGVAAVDFLDAPLLDGDIQGAGIRAVQRTGGSDGGVSPGLGLGSRHARL